MIEFLQTLAIAVIPSVITAIFAYMASSRNAKTQIRAIQEQNKADMEKLVQQNKVDIEALKEKHRLEMEMKEKEHQHQIDMANLQYQNQLKLNEDNMKNQLAANTLGDLFSGMFSQESPISGVINDAIKKGLEDSVTKK